MSGGSLFAHRDFRLLLIGQTTSQLGAQVSGVAIPLLAILTLHATPFQLGVVTAAGTLAFALIGLPAGAWLDRTPRRPVLIASDVARAALLASIPAAAWLGVLTLAQLIVVSFLAGVARVFFDVGYQSYIPSVIGRDRVLAGNSAMESVRASGQVVGPGIAGWLVALLGAANVVLVQAATFAVSALSLVAIRAREAALPPAERPHLWREIKEGLSFVAGNAVLRALAATSAALNLSFAMASAVSLIFMSRTLGLAPTAIGGVIAVGSLTVVAAAALIPVIARAVGSARVVWLSLAVTGPVGMLGPLAQPGWLVALIVVSMAAGELGQIVYSVTSVSLRQRLCPEHMLGRVNSTMRVAIMGVFPLGALIGGALGELVGLRFALWAAGSLIVLSTVPVCLALRQVRDVEEMPPW